MSDYEINEKDIDKALNYLKLMRPDRATPEMAIFLLEYMQATAHSINHVDPDLLDTIFEESTKKKLT